MKKQLFQKSNKLLSIQNDEREKGKNKCTQSNYFNKVNISLKEIFPENKHFSFQ